MPNIESNVRATTFCIAEARRCCWKCASDTAVFACVVPKGHEVLAELTEGIEFDSDEAYAAWRGLPQSTGWVAQATEGVLAYVVHLPESIQARMTGLSDSYRRDFSNMTQTFYWMNHCQRCGAKQGDFYLIDEFDAPLRPIHPESASAVLLHLFFEPFEAQGEVLSFREGILGFMQFKLGR